MGKIKVRPGRVDLGQALLNARQGDTIVLFEGVHHIPELTIFDLHIVGQGDPERIVVNGQLTVHGHCTLENFSIHAPGGACAIYAEGSSLHLRNVAVHSDPTAEFVGIYADACTINMEASAIFTPSRTKISMSLTGCTASISDTFMAQLHLVSSQITVANSSFSAVSLVNQASITSSGSLTIEGADGQVLAQLSGGSRLTATLLVAGGSDPQIDLVDSDLVLEGCNSLTVYRKGEGSVHVPAHVTLVDLNPKVIEWRADQGTFEQCVTQHLRVGDTLRIFEGSYTFESEIVSLRGVKVEGVGDRDEIVWNAQISVTGEQHLELSNFTIQPASGHNSLYLNDGASLTATSIRFLPEASKKFPNLWVGANSIARLEQCTDWYWTDATYDTIWLQNGARLEAAGCAFGWLTASDRSKVSLSNCSALRFYATTEATISSDDAVAVRKNELQQRPIVVASGGAISFARLINHDPEAQALVRDGSLAIADVQGSLLLIEEGKSHVDVRGDVRKPQRSVPVQEEVTPVEMETIADPLGEIQDLVGLHKVKKQIDSFVKLVKFNEALKAKGGTPVTTSMHSLFLGNPGTGKTTVARLFGRALYQAGAVAEDKFIEVSRQELVAEHIGGTATKTMKVLEQALGGVLFIDEAYSLYKDSPQDFGGEAIEQILKFMEDHRDEIVIIFAGYTKQMHDFLSMNPGLASRAPNRFDFEDYTAVEIAEMGSLDLRKRGFNFDEGAYCKVVMQSYSKTADKSNGRWIRNFNDRLLTNVAVRFADDPNQDPFEILATDLAPFVGGSTDEKQDAVTDILAELDALVGLDPVKKFVRELVAQVAVDQRLGESNKPSYHMIFSGNPGTGKTTVARIVGKLFYNLGILSKPDVYETGRAELIGSFIGHTERNTERVLDMAMGGVLFVDEAYQLSAAGTSNDFGRQAIETLLVRLENDRDKFIAIFAGYTNDMDEFLASNPGLRSRVPLTIEFPDYTPEEIAEIVVAILSKRWTFDEAKLRSVVIETYGELPAQERSNGRWARNFAEHIEKMHKTYVFDHPEIGPEELRHIRAEVYCK